MAKAIKNRSRGQQVSENEGKGGPPQFNGCFLPLHFLPCDEAGVCCCWWEDGKRLGQEMEAGKGQSRRGECDGRSGWRMQICLSPAKGPRTTIEERPFASWGPFKNMSRRYVLLDRYFELS